VIPKREVSFEHRFQGPPKLPVIVGAWQPREIKCKDCGVGVTARSRSTKRCEPCQTAATARLMQRANERVKARRRARRDS
jgi:hypothetical protein